MKRACWLPILCAAGCIFTFENPVASQKSGTVTGQVKLGTSVAGQSLAGAQVDLLWSNLSVTLGASGEFGFLALPDGTYTLRYTVGPAASPVAVGELLDIFLPPLPGGGADTIALGTITVDTAGTVQGSVVGIDGGAVVAAFKPDLPDGGVGEYEGFSVETFDGGSYTLILPPGPHELWASTSTQSLSLQVTVDAGEVLTGQDFNLGQAAPATGTASLTGYAVLGDLGASASVAQVTPTADALAVALTPAGCPSCGLSVAFQAPNPPAGISAVELTQPLEPGLLYDVEVSPPAALDAPPVLLHGIPSIAGRATFLRQIFVFSQKTLAANAAGASDAGASSDGGGVWAQLGTIPSGTDIAQVSVLPYPGKPLSHLVSFIDANGALWSSDDADGGSFGTPTVLNSGPFSTLALSGAAYVSPGGPTDALGLWSSTQAGAEIQTNTNGAWANPGFYALPTPVVTFAVALAADPTNDLWYATCQDGGLQLSSATNGSSVGPTAFDGGIAVQVAATSCPQGVCLAWLDSSSNVWVGALDTDAGVLGGQEIDPGPSAFAAGDIAPSIASLPGGGIAAAWQFAVGGGATDFAVQMSSPTGPPSAPLTNAGLATGSPPPLVLPWRGSALLISGGGVSGGAPQALSLASGLPTPLFPATAKSGSQPSGYVDANGNLVVALDTGTSVELYTLPP